MKIQVSEAGEAIFGSSNITRTSFEGWNEYSVSVRGPVVPELLESYRQIGGAVAESHLREAARAATRHRGGPAPGILVVQSERAPGGMRPARLARAERRDRPPHRDGRRRPGVGADHQLLLQAGRAAPGGPGARRAPGRAGGGATTRTATRCRRPIWPGSPPPRTTIGCWKAGVRVYENRHGEHSKIMLIDGDWVAFGSYNFEDAAHDRLAEAMLASRDPRAVEPAASIFDALRRHPDNALVTAQGLASLPARLKVKRAMLGPIQAVDVNLADAGTAKCNLHSKPLSATLCGAGRPQRAQRPQSRFRSRKQQPSCSSCPLWFQDARLFERSATGWRTTFQSRRVQMTAEELRFKEIEHKYIVDERFDLQRFRDVVATLRPARTFSIRVRDRYYPDRGRPCPAFRDPAPLRRRAAPADREDARAPTPRSASRSISISDITPATSRRRSTRFSASWASSGSGTLHKDLEVWDFPDCEVVHYQASTDRRSVRCVEFEATRKDSLDGGACDVEKYERATGFDARRQVATAAAGDHVSGRQPLTLLDC